MRQQNRLQLVERYLLEKVSRPRVPFAAEDGLIDELR